MKFPPFWKVDDGTSWNPGYLKFGLGIFNFEFPPRGVLEKIKMPSPSPRWFWIPRASARFQSRHNPVVCQSSNPRPTTQPPPSCRSPFWQPRPKAASGLSLRFPPGKNVGKSAVPPPAQAVSWRSQAPEPSPNPPAPRKPPFNPPAQAPLPRAGISTSTNQNPPPCQAAARRGGSSSSQGRC